MFLGAGGVSLYSVPQWLLFINGCVQWLNCLHSFLSDETVKLLSVEQKHTNAHTHVLSCCSQIT